jgi:hypothetical protein
MRIEALVAQSVVSNLPPIVEHAALAGIPNSGDQRFGN